MSMELINGLKELDIDPSQKVIGQLEEYLNLLEKWNRAINLTAIRDRNQMILLHLFDSLSVNKLLHEHGVVSLIDVGTGAGLPAIPLQLINPQWEVSAIESNQKKAAFLTQVKLELSLNHFTVINDRVENWEGKKFPCIISRAFSDLVDYVERTKHLLLPNGFWVAMKGVVPFDEMERLPSTLDVTVSSLMVPGLNAQRHALIIRNRTN